MKVSGEDLISANIFNKWLKYEILRETSYTWKYITMQAGMEVSGEDLISANIFNKWFKYESR